MFNNHSWKPKPIMIQGLRQQPTLWSMPSGQVLSRKSQDASQGVLQLWQVTHPHPLDQRELWKFRVYTLKSVHSESRVASESNILNTSEGSHLVSKTLNISHRMTGRGQIKGTQGSSPGPRSDLQLTLRVKINR